jgi:hypothetical protein
MVVLPVAEEAEFEDHVAPLQAVAGALLIGRVARPQRKRPTDPKYSERDDEDEKLEVCHGFSLLLRSGGREARRRAIASRPNRRENEKRRTTLQRLRTAYASPRGRATTSRPELRA